MDIITVATNDQLHEAAASIGARLRDDFYRSEKLDAGKSFEIYAEIDRPEGMSSREYRAALREADARLLAAIVAIDPGTLVYSRESQMNGGPAYVPAVEG